MSCPRPRTGKVGDEGDGNAPLAVYGYEHLGEDILKEIREVRIGDEGMKVDRMLFDRFAGAVRENDTVRTAVEAGQWDRVLDYVNREVFNKPEDYYTLEKLRKAAAVDRRVTLREIMEKVFDLIPEFKSKDELLEEEFSKFVADHTPPAIRLHTRNQELLQGIHHERNHPRCGRQEKVCLPCYRSRVFHSGLSCGAKEVQGHWSLNISRTTYHVEPVRRIVKTC